MRLMAGHPCRRLATGDRGSLSVEFVIVAPMLFFLLILLLAYGRVTEMNGRFEAAARDAARAATLARSQTEAVRVAERIVRESLPAGTCVGGAPSVRFDPERLKVGSLVTVVATCEYSLADVALPGMPGSLTKEVSFSSRLDGQREFAP